MKNYFPPHELECKHCGENKTDPNFLIRINKLRHAAGFPFYPSSVYRCPEHNRAVSRTGPNGPHTTGRAIDIRVYGEQALWIIENARRFGFTGIGINQRGDIKSRFIHLDDLEQEQGRSRPWIWSY